jgi:hypothetical protein
MNEFEATRKFFVMLSLNNGDPTPMINEQGDPHLFDTEEMAYDAAENNLLGQAFKYKVYEW